MANRFVVLRYFLSESGFYDNTLSKNSYSNIITRKEYINRSHHKGQVYQKIDYDGVNYVTRKYIIRDISEYSDHSEYPDCGYQRILMERIDE